MNETPSTGQPTHDQIAACAYLIWELEGRPEGREREHWAQAETQLLVCRAHDGWTGRAEETAAAHSTAE